MADKKRPMAFSFVTRLKRGNHHLQRQWGDRMTTRLWEIASSGT
jgi:hypothetical protein